MAVVNMRQNAAGGPGWQLPSRGLQQHLLGVAKANISTQLKYAHTGSGDVRARRWQDLVESKAPLNE